jgi:hypothetical protein
MVIKLPHFNFGISPAETLRRRGYHLSLCHSLRLCVSAGDHSSMYTWITDNDRGSYLNLNPKQQIGKTPLCLCAFAPMNPSSYFKNLREGVRGILQQFEDPHKKYGFVHISYASGGM